MPITVMIQPTSLSISSERSLMLDEPRVSFVKQSLPSRGGLREHDNVAPVIQPDLEYQDCHQVPHDPWWSSPLMPVVFIFSAMVSGIAAVMLLYMFLCGVRGVPIDMRCVDTVAKYLFYTFLIDFTLELLDLIHRIYESDEWFRSLDFMVHTKLYFPHIVIQILLSTVMPIVLLAMTQVLPLSEARRKFTYGVTGCLTLIGIFAMRWNVVIGGQLFSKSVLGYSIHKMGFVAREGPLVAIFLTLLPFFIGWTLIKLLPPWAGDVLARHAPHRCRAWGRFEVN